MSEKREEVEGDAFFAAAHGNSIMTFSTLEKAEKQAKTWVRRYPEDPAYILRPIKKFTANIPIEEITLVEEAL